MGFVPAKRHKIARLQRVGQQVLDHIYFRSHWRRPLGGNDDDAHLLAGGLSRKEFWYSSGM
jgi:hypothetical protein